MLLGVALLGVGLLAACGPGGPPPPITVPAPELEPWEVPAEELATQRLYRAHYDGPEGDGGFRLTLRLQNLDRWQAQANALGRKLWSLEADGDTGLWIDHRADVHCRLDDRLELANSLLAPLPFRAFPALLLGRLPEPPASRVGHRRGEVWFAGADGRRWGATLEGGRITGWTLAQGDRTVAWWRLQDEEAMLWDRDNRVRLRWRLAVREPLAVALSPLTPPPSYQAVECQGLDLEVRDGETLDRGIDSEPFDTVPPDL